MKRESNKWLWIILIVILLGLMIPGAVSAQGSDPTDDEVNAIAKQLYCPVCENIPLDACGTAACEQWRGIIREKLKEGWTEDQIKNYFVAQYGDRVLAEPPRQGFNWLVYLVPLVVFAGGGYLLYRGFDQWKKGEGPAKAKKQNVSQPDIDEKYLKRIEDELKKRSGGLK
jgi:cytochrome c-type biogenesis protein CcmH